MSSEMHNIFNGARLNERQVSELIGFCRGIIADKVVNTAEAEVLQAWLAANAGITDNPVVCNLLRRINAMMSDNVIDKDEQFELLETLQKFTGDGLELGEVLKSTSLPLDEPPPDLLFNNARYCFTGTFAFGTRAECEAEVAKRGGLCGSLTQKTNYLIVGIYATESWMQSTYGRKIEKAVTMQEDGFPIKLVGEEHWTASLNKR